MDILETQQSPGLLLIRHGNTDWSDSRKHTGRTDIPLNASGGLGANLAAKWKLPADLVQAIRNHHRPASAFSVADPLPLRKSLHIMQVANQLAKYCYPHSDRMEIDAVPDEVFSLLGLDPSLPSLLTSDVRKAISKAIFFATANTKRKATAPRRFLRPVCKEDAANFLATPADGQPQIVEDEKLMEKLFGPEAKELKIGGRHGSRKVTDVAHAKFVLAGATVTGIEECLKAVLAHQEQMNLHLDPHSIAQLTIKSMLANILPISDKKDTIEVVQLLEGRRLTIALRAPGLSIERRLGRAPAAGEARRIAEADLASLLNLGWFSKITTSADGSTRIFVGN